MLKKISTAISQLSKQLWKLPHTIANVAKERDKQTALDELEAERIDRIRNPSKYLGK